MLKKISLFTIIALLVFDVNASRIKGHFFVTDKEFDFTKSIISGKCTGKIHYPFLSHDEEELIDEINDEILDFVELYAICNEGQRDNFSVSYDLPNSGSDEYFSVRWVTKKDGKIYRIDSLNFSLLTTQIVGVDDIFNDLSSQLLSEIIKLSQGNLKPNIDWDMFLDKIGKRDVQFYIKNKEWYIVFNATEQSDNVVEVKLPKYFMHGDAFSEK